MSSTLPRLVSLFPCLLGHSLDQKFAFRNVELWSYRAAVGSILSLAAKTMALSCRRWSQACADSLNTLFCKPGKDFPVMLCLHLLYYLLFEETPLEHSLFTLILSQE